jgi:site-specific recombinase XerD
MLNSENQLLIVEPQSAFTLMPETPDKDTKYRLNKYLDWLHKVQGNWLKPDLKSYRDFLLEVGLSPTTVSTHLGTIRGRYQAILDDPQLRDMLYSYTSERAMPSDRKAIVDEYTKRLEMAINPARAKVKVVSKQDIADTQHLRLSATEAETLMKQPGIETLKGLRDTAIIGLFLCTGIRENELRMLDVVDLRQTLNGELSLHVREGKGSKTRLVPYGDLSWILAFVDAWLKQAGIHEGPVFRGFYKGNQKLREQRISLRQVSYILDAYPIMMDGELRKVKPHDCRRTYARRLFDEGVDINRIRENLGHTSIQTTLGYIGELAPHERRPPAIYKPPYRLTSL